MSTSYFELLKDPRWQRKRLEIMERDNFTCQECEDTEATLNVHHKAYAFKKMAPWEYPDDWLITLCEGCHEYRSDMEKTWRFIPKDFATAELADLGLAILEWLSIRSADELRLWIGVGQTLELLRDIGGQIGNADTPGLIRLLLPPDCPEEIRIRIRHQKAELLRLLTLLAERTPALPTGAAGPEEAASAVGREPSVMSG